MKRILCLLLLISFSAYAEEAKPEEKSPAPETSTGNVVPPPGEDYVYKVGYFDWLTNIPGDYAAAWTTLTRKETIPSWIAVAGTTAVGVKYDYETWQAFRKIYKKNSTFEAISDAGAQFGVGGSQIALGGIMAAYGLIAGSDRPVRTGSQILESVIATGITTQIIKHIVGRESPNCATEPRTGKWQWFTNPRKYHNRVSAHDAFPSGHVATAMATATVVIENYPEQTWIPYVAYPTVFLVGMGMVATDGHWWADYPLSVLLGYHYGMAATRRNPEAKGRSKRWVVDLWMPKPEVVGLQLTGRF